MVFWFCPVYLISCSTKRNLTRHTRQIHKDNSFGENVEGNCEKFIFLGWDDYDEEQAELKNDQETTVNGCQFGDDDSVSLENLQRISFIQENSAEHFSFQEQEQRTYSQVVSQLDSCLAGIETHYRELSKDLRHSMDSFDEQNFQQEISDSNSETDCLSDETVSDDSTV